MTRILFANPVENIHNVSRRTSLPLSKTHTLLCNYCITFDLTMIPSESIITLTNSIKLYNNNINEINRI